MEDPSFQIKSPCTGICTLNDRNVCAGCFRSLDEIARWGSSNLFEKSSILARCESRKLALESESLAEGKSLVPAS